MASGWEWVGALATAVGLGVGSTLGVQCYMKDEPGMKWKHGKATAKADLEAREYRLIQTIHDEKLEYGVNVSGDAVKAANAAVILSGLEQREDGQYIPRSMDMQPQDLVMRFASMADPKAVTRTGRLVDIVTKEGAEHAKKLAGERLGAYDFSK